MKEVVNDSTIEKSGCRVTLLKTFIRSDRAKSARIQIVPQLGSGAIKLAVNKHKLLENFVEDEAMIEYGWHC